MGGWGLSTRRRSGVPKQSTAGVSRQEDGREGLRAARGCHLQSECAVAPPCLARPAALNYTYPTPPCPALLLPLPLPQLRAVLGLQAQGVNPTLDSMNRMLAVALLLYAVWVAITGKRV